jgi:putative oxidoreductase
MYEYVNTTRYGAILQRMFSMFPAGWPGIGLLILRLAASLPLFIGVGAEPGGVSSFWLYVLRFAMLSVGVLLLAGLWTPIAGALQAIIQLGAIFSLGNAAIVHVLLAALGMSLVMLGPGAWSVDARLFGRKRIDIR